MTTPSTPRKAGPLLGTGAQTSWPFTFKVFAATDIAVTIVNDIGTETNLVLGADYNVTLNANQDTSPGGTVTYPISGAPLPVGSKLTIIGNLPYDQPLDLPAGGNFSPLAIENELDRLVMQIQQLREIVSRALQVRVTSGASVVLPSPVASNVIGWNAAATGLENVPVEDFVTVVAYGNHRYDTFAGDGVTTTFALTENPAVIGNLDVSISGVVQIPAADYLLANGNLVFTNAPANGTTVLARYGEALPQTSLTFGTAAFTGDGVQTNFVLPALPQSEDSTQVYVSGVYQQKSTYSLSSNTLIFSEAPPLNAKIEVSYF